MAIADDHKAIGEAYHKLTDGWIPRQDEPDQGGVSDYDVEVVPGSAPLSWTTCIRVARMFDCKRRLCYWNMSKKCVNEQKCIGVSTRSAE